MASTSDFRNGMVLDIDGVLMTIVEFQHVKPGKGGAFVRTKLKNVLSGSVIDRTYRAGEKFNEIRLDYTPLQYLYKDGPLYYFMDSKTYEQFPVSGEVIGEQVKYLKENIDVTGVFHEDTLLLVELPFFIDLKVVETDPGLRGDTVSGATKPARLESGATVNVPLFVNVGDKIKIDRRTNAYLERA
ncbi:MAG: elongation factor P [Candidatus Glassbacteria bacterium RIFCSPLOWO2_12_FULL_58_11]|uniref:Elongation factor P n=1 Tax=Candidatus Glassbacteria bacterium RIFCSPLOWO2_12_FULL_58_11 TaxID=1817867 RepID=A0A1F5YPG7_9BACT|nr:MAG: elongation factor P [Candidatus Glassbacteria bacterium RIFCSPLOWO2_12_FULL_58_11]